MGWYKTAQSQCSKRKFCGYKRKKGGLSCFFLKPIHQIIQPETENKDNTGTGKKIHTSTGGDKGKGSQNHSYRNQGYFKSPFPILPKKEREDQKIGGQNEVEGYPSKVVQLVFDILDFGHEEDMFAVGKVFKGIVLLDLQREDY